MRLHVTVPNWIGKKDSEIMQSHYRFWRMIRDFVDLNGPFKPVKVFKHASQSLYSKTKGGVDGATDYLSDVSFPLKNFSFEVKFVLRSVFMVTINACIAYRMHRRRDLVAGDDIPVRLVKNLKSSVRDVESVADFIFEAGKELLVASPAVVHSTCDQASIETDNVVGSLTKEELVSLQKKITTGEPLKFFNSEEGQRLRLTRGNHVPVMNAIDPKLCNPSNGHVDVCFALGRSSLTAQHVVSSCVHLWSQHSGRLALLRFIRERN